MRCETGLELTNNIRHSRHPLLAEHDRMMPDQPYFPSTTMCCAHFLAWSFLVRVFHHVPSTVPRLFHFLEWMTADCTPLLRDLCGLCSLLVRPFASNITTSVRYQRLPYSQRNLNRQYWNVLRQVCELRPLAQRAQVFHHDGTDHCA